MKTNYGKILVLIVSAAILLAAPLPCRAGENKEENIWREDRPRWGLRSQRFELTEEVIERMMDRLREAEPEKAEELERLRDEDPEKFKAELRKAMREQLGGRYGQRMEHQGGRRLRADANRPLMGPGGRGKPAGIGPGPGGPGERRGGQRREMTRERMRERHGEFIEWFKKNYPEEAEELAELRKEKPELYRRKLGLCLRRYRRIFEAAEENPELAQVLKETIEINEERNELLKKIKATDDEAEKKELIEQLKDVVGKKFDLLVRRKQVRYEHLLKKLEDLKNEVKESEAEVEKWKDAEFKNKNVKAHVEELISGIEKFKWD